jgi:hypothetical protein
MLKTMDGESRLVAAMRGAKSTARTTIRNAGAENFVSRAFGVRRRIQGIIHGKSPVLSITAQHESELQMPPTENLSRSNHGI